MEHKIEMTLSAMGEILSKCFQPSHTKLYALRKLGIEMPMVHHRDRKKLSCVDKKKLYRLLNRLNQYVDHYGVNDFLKYYINMWTHSLIEILND
jgi:hypothetical protein